MAKPRRNANVKLLGVVRRRRPALLVSTALCATFTMVVSLPAAAQLAPNAHPTGGVVLGGGIAIRQTASQTTINQSTQRGAIGWQAFNVGSQQTVQFNQPSATSMTLNRVEGPNPSQIAGRIDANGQIILENQSGVTFYKGSQVNTAGLMVSAARSSNAAVRTFVGGGNLVMDQAAHPNASVVNQGQITIRQAGLAALVAPQVRNDGVITARLGHVVLASGTRTTLDLYGDGMLSIDVTGLVRKLPNGATALVTNSGVIVADGGTIQLSARAADGLVQTLVDAGGRIQANSVGGRTGTITMNGVGGSITVEGQLDAMGKAPGTSGGTIVVNTTGNVTVASTARIDASGQAGGGVVAIGTTLARAKGGPGVVAKRTAANVTVRHGATIAANATGKGDGGRVTVLSTDTTQMDGAISATGGPQGGNGGFVETSGYNLGISADASVDVGAPAASGTPGTWLLDPFDVAITTAHANTGPVTAAGTTTFSGSADPATIANTTLQTALGSDNVVVTTSGGGTDAGNITVSDSVTWSSSNSLSLLADNNIAINAAISGTNGGLTLSAGNTALSGSITITAPVSVKTFSATAGSGGTINLNDGAGTAVTTGAGGQTYNSPVVLQAATTLSGTGGGQIQFAKAVDGAQSLTVTAGTGTVTFGAAVGGATPLTSLTVTGPTKLHGNVTTTGIQTYNSAVTMAASAALATANGAIDFVSTVDGGFGLAVNAGTGLVTFGGVVGGTAALASLDATGG
ncbi:MAG TPA: filamentous hemagglutinin N-terminal domain-containing protein, partial [Acetobacteraceae bacterium]|nr:filamentous hemagglutinin N-terminal domain-containing protein [Acetobacteraceae bacterium]